MTAGRNKRMVVRRITKLLLFLRAKPCGVTSREVARALRVSTRTASRYLEDVERAGLPIIFEVVEAGEVRDVQTSGATRVAKLRWSNMVWKLVEGWR